MTFIIIIYVKIIFKKPKFLESFAQLRYLMVLSLNGINIIIGCVN